MPSGRSSRQSSCSPSKPGSRRTQRKGMQTKLLQAAAQHLTEAECLGLLGVAAPLKVGVVGGETQDESQEVLGGCLWAFCDDFFIVDDIGEFMGGLIQCSLRIQSKQPIVFEG